MSSRITATAAGLGFAALVIAAVIGIQLAAGDASASGGRSAGNTGAASHVDPDTNTPLASDEIAGLAFMREEEKLARDMYALLADS